MTSFGKILPNLTYYVVELIPHTIKMCVQVDFGAPVFQGEDPKNGLIGMLVEFSRINFYWTRHMEYKEMRREKRSSRTGKYMAGETHAEYFCH